MFTVYADFNACASDRRIWMDTVGSRKSLEQTGAKPGDWVWLSDGDELRAGGKLEESDGRILARVAWETLEYIIPEDDERRTPEQFQAAAEEFGKQSHSQSPNYREILRILPWLERALPPGKADAIRGRAAQALGYPALALLAIDDALRADPAVEEWILFRLDLLRELDLEDEVTGPPPRFHYLECRPDSRYRQLFIKGRKLRAEVVYLATLGPEPRPPSAVAEDYGLPVEAVLEAVEYCEHHANLLSQERAEEERLLRAHGARNPAGVPANGQAAE